MLQLKEGEEKLNFDIEQSFKKMGMEGGLRAAKIARIWKWKEVF